MKRILVCLLLLSVMFTGMMNVQAAEADITVRVRASKTEVSVGDTVEYTVYATGSGVVAMQFEVRFPEGLRYVPNSGATPVNLAQNLGVPAADWTEVSKMFTFYNDIGITFAENTQILQFTCVAEKEGQWEPELYELLPFDGDFEEFVPGLQVQKIRAVTQESSTSPEITEPTTLTTEPVTQPTTVVPDETVQPSEPDSTVSETEPVFAPDGTEPPLETVPEHIGQISGADPLEEELPSEPEAGQLPDKHPPEPENKLLWVVIPVGAVLILCGVAVFLIWKKKRI